MAMKTNLVLSARKESIFINNTKLSDRNRNQSSWKISNYCIKLFPSHE